MKSFRQMTVRSGDEQSVLAVDEMMRNGRGVLARLGWLLSKVLCSSR